MDKVTSASAAAVDQATIRIGVSSCLIGEEVRFDGGHKRNDFLVEMLGRYVEFVPICPEFDLGLGVPRESLRLARGEAGEIRMVGNETGTDLTDAMRAYAARRVGALQNADLSGYVFKRDSPSCGMERVRVYGKSGMPARDGRGLFATALMERYPNLPVEEEGRLDDPNLRENFIERVFAYRRLTKFFSGRWTTAGLVAFHAAHKLQLLAHSPGVYAELSGFAGNPHGQDRAALRRRYERDFMRALAKPATPVRHVNVLKHIANCLKNRLDARSRIELGGVIEDYRGGLLPLVVPVMLMRHYVGLFDIACLKGQLYLEPHPKELMLRNHV